MQQRSDRRSVADLKGPPAAGRAAEPASGLAGFFIGGFECSTKRRADGRRLDLLESTGHARLSMADFASLKRRGINTARDGLRWHLIEERPGKYDWSSALTMVRAARACNMQVIWDLCHYGWPDWLDIWSPDFVSSFAEFGAEAARFVARESGTAPFFCTVNEISFWAWAGGEMGRFAPAGHGRGAALKRQLVRASLAAIRAVRTIEPEARFLHAEPLIHVASPSPAPSDSAAAERYRLAQFEALDMIVGRLAPELGGSQEALDLVGVNFYPENQWYHGGSTIPFGHHAYRPLREMLGEVHSRYGRPLVIAETGAEGTARSSWFHYVCSEVAAVRNDSVPVEGICLYPILDYPGWDNDRHCAVGLLSAPDSLGRRRADPDFAAELKRQQEAFAGLRPAPIQKSPENLP
jgi:hypothetical protein